NRAYAPGSTLHWRRYRADAPGGGFENSGGGGFWSDKSGAQRPVWDAIDRAAKRDQHDRPYAARRTGTRSARNHGRRSYRRGSKAVAESYCRNPYLRSSYFRNQ